MKRIFVLFFVIILILSACSSNEIESTSNMEEESVKNNEREINESEINEPDESHIDLNIEEQEQEIINEDIESAETEVVEISLGTVEELTQDTITQAKPEEVKDQIKEPLITEEPYSQSTTDNSLEEKNSIKIQGLVTDELSLSLEELKVMDDLIFQADYYWLNSFGTTGHTNYKGINLWKLLDNKASLSPEATKITIIAQDGYKVEFNLEQVKKQDYIDETNPEAKYPMIIAWEENGEEYSINDGAPFKLIVGQKEAGDVNKPQWVSNIDSIIVE